MPKIIKKDWDVALAVVIGLVLTVVGIIGLSSMVARPSSVTADTATETVEVSATVAAWVSLEVTPTTTTLTPDLVTSAGGVNIGESDYIQITTGTNNVTGYSLDIKSLNGALCHSTGCATGTISSASTTLVAGIDGYGAQANSSDGDVTIATSFDHATSTNTVGGLIQTDDDLADTGSESSDDIIWLTLKAAATSTKTVGTYEDTITLTLTSL
ncbi:hypothetical protein AMJ50_02880 [Parcubacteria bacterium DG_74_3]|nr:MAG: hypothetical protein AMJ50_02880 [Parcubacteria bacterium DG_74_3]